MPEVVWRVRPTESFDYFRNPHKGCATFQRFEGDELYPDAGWSEEGPIVFPARKYPSRTPNYLPASVAYCRWFWRVFQPEKNRFDWTVIDQAIATARDRNQTLQVRLMPYGSARQPQLPDWYSSVGRIVENNHKSNILLGPDHSGDDFRQWWGNAVKAFAERYDGNPTLESFDLSHIGPWGEGAGECTADGIERMAQIYVKAFKQTPLLAMVGSNQLPMAVKFNTGWRCDCFGDMRLPGSYIVPKRSSNTHTHDAYPFIVHNTGATDCWKRGPVVFETCGNPLGWYEHTVGGGEEYPLDFIIRQGLKFHGSVFMPKSCRIPEPYYDRLLGFMKQMGYRFVFRHIKYDISAPVGGMMNYSIWIENVGVAPMYRDYPFVIRLQQDSRIALHRVETSVKNWLPGDVILEGKMPVPDGFEQGPAMLSAGLVDPKTNAPAVKFAVKEQDSAGWVELDKLWLK